MTRDGEGMQVPCTLHFKGHKKFIAILKDFEGVTDRHSLNWTDTFCVMQRKTEYTAASKYTTYFLTCHVLINVVRVIEAKIHRK